MAYEYGCIVGMGEHDIIGTKPTIELAKRSCEELQRDWDGTSIDDWHIVGGELHGSSEDPGEPWYIREAI